jgi:Glycosyl transferase 4-like domain
VVGKYVVREPGGDERTPHVLIVSYLFPPSEVSGVRRAVAFRDAFLSMGVRTTVLTSEVAGRLPEDEQASVFRTPDLRVRFGSQYRVLAGAAHGPIVRTKPRWWTRLIVPDVTALSWSPTAVARALRLTTADRPDAVFTTSPPESVHLTGLALRTRGVPWIADLRDGWTFEPGSPRPYVGSLDRALERLVVRSANRVTAVTRPLVSDLRNRYPADGRVEHLSNGFDPARLARATDERRSLDHSRFTIVYTGSGSIDGKDPRPFLCALDRLLSQQPSLQKRIEVAFAGTFTTAELDAMRSPGLARVVRYLGRVEHERALGFQCAADGLLLITTVGASHVSTGKIYEYLAAEKPILALANRNAAVELLARSGGHVSAPPEDEDAIVAALSAYVDAWVLSERQYEPSPDFRLDDYAFPRIARRLLDLFVDIGAFDHRSARV